MTRTILESFKHLKDIMNDLIGYLSGGCEIRRATIWEIGKSKDLPQ